MMREIFLFTILILTACLDQGPITTMPTEDHEEDDILKMEWATRMDPTKDIVGTDNTQLYDGTVIVTGDIGDPPTLWAYDIVTGEKVWTYIHDGKMTHEIFTSKMIDAIYIAKSSQGVFAFDCANQTLLWEIYFQDIDLSGGGSIQILDGQILLNLYKNDNTPDRLVQIAKVNPQNGAISILYETSSDVIGYSHLSHFQNDTLSLYIFNEYYIKDLGPNDRLQSMIAIDALTKEEVWKQENYTDNFACNVSLLLPIIDNVIVSGGDWSMYGFDVITGEKLWRRELPFGSRTGRYTKTEHLVHNGLVYVNDAEYNISCLDPQNGNVLWSSEDAPNCSDHMIYYEKEDVLVFSSWGNGAITVIDALTGETLHKEKDDMGSNYSTKDLVYDPETDMFSTRTYKHVVGFTISR